VAMAIIGNFLFGPIIGFGVQQIFGPSEKKWPTAQERAAAPYMRDFARRIGAEGGVVADFRMLSRFVNRPSVYSLHHIYSGNYTLSTKPYPIPEDVAALAADVGDPFYVGWSRPDGGNRLRRLLELNRLAPVDSAGDAVLFLKDAKEPHPLWETGDFVPDFSRRTSYNGQLMFLGWDRLPEAVLPGGRLPIRTLWKRTGGFGGAAFRYYRTQFILLDEGGTQTLSVDRRIGYTFYPVHDWPAGRTVRERYNLVIDETIPPGRYTLGLRLLEEAGGEVRASMPSDESLRKANGVIVLGEVVVKPRSR
jgi:hypothetical protein